jgi:hypothetical protein
MRRAIFLVLAGATVMTAQPATFGSRVAPILEQHCTVCHGAEKQKAELRLDGHAVILAGAKEGLVVKPGDAKASELFRRITLPETDDDVMPSDGKPHLSRIDIAVIEKWIAAGAPETAEFDAPAPAPVVMMRPAAPDYTLRLGQANALAAAVGLRLVPRSRVATDGLILRTASAPARCDDAALATLAPVADLIVEAELARTKITDAGLVSIAAWRNLLRLDLSRTTVTSAGVPRLAGLEKLEALNLSETTVDGAGAAALRALPGLKKVWAFGTSAEQVAAP